MINATDRVLRLLSVGSKRFLTNKVDRSVTGLIAQQQCVGPLHIPAADVAVIAQVRYEFCENASHTIIPVMHDFDFVYICMTVNLFGIGW